MKYNSLKYIFFLIMFFPVYCSSDMLSNDNSGKTLQNEMLNDIEYLYNELPKKHKNLFFKISKNDFKYSIDNLINKVKSQQLTIEEFYIEVKKLVSLVGDGHTTATKDFGYMFPASFWILEDGLFLKNTIEKHKNMLKMKLIKINGIPIRLVFNMLKDVVPNENPTYCRLRTAALVVDPVILYGLHVINNKDEVILTFEDKYGKFYDETFKVELDNKKITWFVDKNNYDYIPEFLKNGNVNYWFKYYDDKKTLFYKYNSCMEIKDKPFESFSKEIFNVLENKEVKKLIVDLRGNSGGNSLILDPFINKVKSYSNINKFGTLFVIIDKYTFSSAILNALSFIKETNAILIGEPTSGKPNHFGEVKSFILPYSKIKINYSTKYFQRIKDDDSSLYPDIMIEIYSKSFFIGKDSVLEYIYNLSDKEYQNIPRIKDTVEVNNYKANLRNCVEKSEKKKLNYYLLSGPFILSDIDKDYKTELDELEHIRKKIFSYIITNDFDKIDEYIDVDSKIKNFIKKISESNAKESILTLSFNISFMNKYLAYGRLYFKNFDKIKDIQSHYDSFVTFKKENDKWKIYLGEID